jgi:hypothetical protein
VHGGREVLAFRRRTPRQRFNHLGGIERALAEQFAYNAAVQQVFFTGTCTPMWTNTASRPGNCG